MKTSLQTLLCGLCLVLFISCGRSNASRITNILDKCAQISHRAAAYNGSPGGQANYIAAEFQKLDVSGCPADFRMAFEAHIFAWLQAAPALGNNNLITNIGEGIAAGMTEDPRFIGQAGGQAAYATQQINTTYYQLTQIAASHGARIPRSVAGE